MNYTTNKESHWFAGLVNAHQSPQERKEKYCLLRSIGVNTSHARAQRDWRMSKLKRLYGDRLGLDNPSVGDGRLG